ncbi:MAG TPA: family 78 glycoside hydrolase catalytic domain [Microbacteriaceae bacterium]|nr:family 78 glycoside hydrolase catalytic domain [Microbacteriaceae bacterium]
MIQPNQSLGLELHAPTAHGVRGLLADGQSARRPAGEHLVATVVSRMPVLSWKLEPGFGDGDDDGGASGFEVEVQDAAGEVVWSSGVVVSSATEVAVGRELRPHSAYAWRVRVADSIGTWSQWAGSTLETGPFEYADWRAQWLAVPHLARIATPFRLEGPIAQARLYLTGQGVVRAWVNETAVNPDRMDPTRTDFVRALFRSYDVTELLRGGENTLDFVCGLGEWARTGESPRLLAELMIWHADGSISRIAPGTESAVAAAQVTVDEPFYLERHDASSTQAVPHPFGAPVVLQPAMLPQSSAVPPLDVSPDPTPPLRRVETFVPTEIGRSPGTRLFDVGVNIAGRSTITLLDGVQEGTVIRVQHGEHVGADGHIDTTNLTMPYDHGRERQLVEYVARGIPGEKHEPWFAYFGFRYLEVRGLPEHARVTVGAYSMHTDLTASGSISTDSPVIENLLATAARTLLNNVHGVPEDCPTREQAAWTGDTGSVAEYELAAFDSANFLAKWIADLETSQQADGQLPAIAPDLHATRMPSDPVWGSALHRMLLGHLLHFGDARLTRRALPTLRRWADFQLSCIDGDGVISRSPISYGHDWLALEQTPPPILHTAGVIDCLSALADLEEAIGEQDAAQQRRLVADDLRTAARRAFFDAETGTFGNGSQGSYAVAIETGILTGREAEAAGERLADLIHERGNRVSSGFATTRTVVRALTMLGRSQVVYDILMQPAEPGVGAMLNSGPGTFWECWWIDPANTGTGSLNHVGLGGPFAAWVWEGLAGLRPTAPGYTKFRIAPQFVDGVTRLELHTETVRGEIAISYSRTGPKAQLRITVPPGSEGTLVIAGQADAALLPGRHAIDIDASEHEPSTPRPRLAPQASAIAPVSIAPISADVVGSRTLLDSAEIEPGRANPTVEVLRALRCMPVPHEQPDHPVLKVLTRQEDPGECAPTVMLGLQTPIPISEVSFVYALIDQCIEGPVRVTSPFLALHLSNGQTRQNSTKGWPAGWNRAVVDTASFDTASFDTAPSEPAHQADDVAIVAIEVGLEYGDGIANNALALYPNARGNAVGFHLAEVGFSTRSRTW